MNWFDYREQLGIGFSNDEKLVKLSNKLSIAFDDYSYNGVPANRIAQAYFFSVGEVPSKTYTWGEIKRSVLAETSAIAVVSKMVALINACSFIKDFKMRDSLRRVLELVLKDLKIPYDTFEDEGALYIFPKGAEELDVANINTTLLWLERYPQTQASFGLALKTYSNNDDPSNCADLFRKALESFVQEFFCSDKNIENLKAEVGNYLKERGVPPELRSNFETTLQMYTNYNNNYAKHHSKTSESFLEFIMYQTGNIIRFLISLSS